MTFVLTNDDGIEAPGLALLGELMQGRGPVVVAAPHEEQSGWSHRVTDAHPISVRHLDSGRYAIEGTPADCARVGLLHLSEAPQWLISGINAGGNLGSDLYMSGTVAAAREAALLKIPAIALSQYRRSRKHPIRWERTRRWAERVLDRILYEEIAPGEFWNVNFPDPDDSAHEPEIVDCPVDPGHHAVRYEETEDGFLYRGVYQDRHREPGCDVDICFAGHIAVSRVRGHGPDG